MEKLKGRYFFVLLLILVMLVDCSLVIADDPFWSGENDPVWNEYGLIKCWFSKDTVIWEEATVDSAELKLGESFYIKVLIKASKDLNAMSFWLSGLGSSAKDDFEVLKEPSNLADNAEIIDMQHSLIEIIIYKPIKNETHEYVWKIRVKPDADWAGGNSPLNVDVQFMTDENHLLGPFTLVNVNILDTLWEGYTNASDENKDGNGAPGFEIPALLFIVCLYAIFRKKIM